jgi:copper chaperone CopZ
MELDATFPARHVDPLVGDDPATIELSIEGMHCQSCVLLIEETLADDPAVDRVVVDLDSARATVTFSPEGISADALCATVTALGYPASPLAPGDPGT